MNDPKLMSALARAVKEIDRASFLRRDAATRDRVKASRDLLVETITDNGYDLDMTTYRVRKLAGKVHSGN